MLDITNSVLYIILLTSKSFHVPTFSRNLSPLIRRNRVRQLLIVPTMERC